MRLPAINPNTLELGEGSFSSQDFFNPSVNPNYLPAHDTTSYLDAINSTMSFTNLIKMMKAAVSNITDPVDLLPSMAAVWGNPVNGLWDTLTRMMWDCFPEDQRHHFLNSCLYSLRTSTSTTYEFKIVLLYPTRVTYQEAIRGATEVKFIVNYGGGHDEPSWISEESKEQFKTKLAEALTTVNAGYTARMNSKLFIGDSLIPRLASLMYKYTNNCSVFYPRNNRDRYTILPCNWMTPAQLKGYQDQGAVATLTVKPNCDSIHFIESTPANNRAVISRVLSYSTNILEYLPFTIQGPKEPKANLYGVELEVSTNYTPAQMIEMQKDLFFCLKQDGSVHGNKANPYEMVTVPCSMKAHKRLWAEFFDKVDYTQFDTSKSTGNGMHVHIDRRVFDVGGQFSKKRNHLNKFTWFFINPSNKDFLHIISERPSMNDLTRWAPFPNIPSDRTAIAAAKDATRIARDLRGAIHYKGNRTVEVRIFKGIVSYATVTKNLEFVDSVVEFTRAHPLSQVSLSKYFAWLKATPKNQYEMLKAFMAEVDLTMITALADLDAFLWGAKEAEDIADKLNRAPFKVTNAHISLLNKRRKKRILCLKEGKVVPLEKNSNKGVLSKLDKLAQQKQTRGASSFAVSQL